MSPDLVPRTGRGGPVVCIAVGIASLAGPLLGVAGTVWGMIRAFQTLGEAGDPGDADALASAVSTALWSTLAGAAVFVFGVALTTIGFVWLSARNRAARMAGA